MLGDYLVSLFFYDGLVFKENYHDLSNILSILASLDDYQMYGVLLVL